MNMCTVCKLHSVSVRDCDAMLYILYNKSIIHNPTHNMYEYDCTSYINCYDAFLSSLLVFKKKKKKKKNL